MTGGFGQDFGLSFGRTTTVTPPVTVNSTHSWVPRMAAGVPSVVDIRGGATTIGDNAPASAPGAVGYNSLILNEQFTAIDSGKWSTSNSVISGMTAFMSANVVTGAGSSLGAVTASSARLQTKREAVSTATFTGGQFASNSGLTLPLYGYYEARVKIPHGQGVSPIWKIEAKNGAAIAAVVVQYLHAVTPGRLSVTYSHQSSAGVSAPVVSATSFFEAPTYSPGWHNLALSLEPVNAANAAAGVLLRGYIDGTKSFEYTDTTATYWTGAGGSSTDFWKMTWTGSQVGGAYIAGPDDVLGVDTARTACSISGTYPALCATTATDGRAIIRAGAPGSTATMGTAATVFEIDYIRAWAFTAYTQAVLGSFSTATTWAWAFSPILGNTQGTDQFASVDVSGLTADDNHVAAIVLRAGSGGSIVCGITDRKWQIEVDQGSGLNVAHPVYSGPITAGATSGKLEAEATGGATATVVQIYWTPTAGSKALIATQTLTTPTAVGSQTGVQLAIWQSTNTLNLTNLTTTGTVINPPVGTPPAAPTLAGSAGNSQAYLSWNIPSGATSVTLKQGTTTLYTGTATSYTAVGLTNGTPYSFTATASNSSGTSPASNTVTVTPTGVVTTTAWKSGASGDYIMNGSFGTWRGKPVTIMGDWADDSPANTAAGDSNLASGGKYYNWTGDADIAVGGLYRNLGETWANFAAGAYDARMTQCFQNLWANWTRIQRGQLYVRVFHEWNGGWNAPYQVMSLSDVPYFKTSWHRVRLLAQKYIPGAKLVCCTNGNGMNYGSGPINGVENAMPAPADYDVYASDIYSTHLEQNSNVFEDHKGIADRAGKPFAIGEWGLHKGEGTPDSFNPTYLNKINSFGRAGNILYDVYFNVNLSSDYQIYPDLGYFPIGGPYYRSLTWGA